MGIEATGKLHSIFETKQVSERFTKREFVLEMSDNPKYPQVVLFQLTGDRCAQLDQFAVGDEVRIDFSLRGREWKSPSGEVKYFNSLDVWKVEPARASSGSSRQGDRGGDRNYERGDRSYGGDPYRGGGGDYGGRGAPRSGGDPRDDVPPPGDDEPRGGGRGRDNDDIPF